MRSVLVRRSLSVTLTLLGAFLLVQPPHSSDMQTYAIGGKELAGAILILISVPVGASAQRSWIDLLIEAFRLAIVIGALLLSIHTMQM